MDDGIDKDVIFNTTFHLQRATALHISGSDQDIASEANLKYHSNRLTNLIRGDVLRGVRVHNDKSDETSSNATGGVLEKVTFEKYSTNQSGAISNDGVYGILIKFNYIKKSYTALLLRDGNTINMQTRTTRRTTMRQPVGDNSNYYPLLVHHLPASITSIFLDYLTTTFDCHISPLHTSSDFAMRVLESYLKLYAPPQQYDDTWQLQPSKDISLTFESPPRFIKSEGKEVEEDTKKMQTLRTMTLLIPKNDIPGFLFHGQKSIARVNRDTSTPSAPTPHKSEGPFETALKSYLYEISGIYMEKLHLQKVSCAPFIFGEASDGSARCKIFNLDQAHVAETDKNVARYLILEELIKEASKSYA